MLLGRRPGEAWLRSRYAGPYLRDELLDLGVMVETLETATGWAGLEGLHRAVGDALRMTPDDVGGARVATAGERSGCGSDPCDGGRVPRSGQGRRCGERPISSWMGRLKRRPTTISAAANAR